MRRFIIDSTHELHIHNDNFSVYSGEIRLFRFFVKCNVPTKDNTDQAEKVRLIETGENKAIWYGENGAWQRKEYTVRVIDKGFVFTTKLFGNGKPEAIEYFRGPADLCGSHFGVAGYMHINAQNTDRDRAMRLMDCTPAELTPMRAAPPPFVFPFFNDYNDDWCGIGVTTRAGNHNFQRFVLNAPSNGLEENGCWFSLPMGGCTEVIDEWKAPTIWCGFGYDGIDIVRSYSKWCYSHYGFNKNIPKNEAPDWWRKPVFCGRGQQYELKRTNGGTAADYSTQSIYGDFCDTLKKLRLSPGTIIIDDKWQSEYGTLEPDTAKWPDLRAFADSQHEMGRHVILWLKCWAAEGLPDDECIFVNGRRFSADPTNPKYAQRLQDAIYRLLSEKEGCFNCDGFKVDFMDNHPRTPDAVTYQKGIAGLELMRLMYKTIYDAAKAAKADALINISCAHPYFADLCDQFRIHDYDSTLRSPISIMEYRADFAGAVMPNVLIDTDGFSAKTAAEQIRIIEAASRIGVPDLYSFPEFFGEKEWDRVRKAWEKHY